MSEEDVEERLRWRQRIRFGTKRGLPKGKEEGVTLIYNPITQA